LIQTADGGFALAGHYGSCILLVKTNTVGDSLWSFTFGGYDELNRCFSAIQTVDGGYVLGGIIGNFGGYVDMNLIKTSPDQVNVPDITKPIMVESLILYPTYPNPFNSTTTIRYGLPHPGNVLLSVYNMAGQQISTLFEGYNQAGLQSTNLIANDLPSGIYLVQLEGSEQVLTQKVMLIK